jgi:ribosomal protein L36
MSDRKFTLITLAEPSAADGHYLRHIWHMYRGFNRLFQVVDIRKYRAGENTADVTILDRFAMFAALFYEGFTYRRLLEQLAGTKNLVFMTSDLHYWSIFPDLIDPRVLAPRRPPRFLEKLLEKTSLYTPHQLAPADNRYDRLFEMFDQLDIRNLITCYDCPELREISSQRSTLRTHVVELHIDPAIFRDYGLRKEYDLIVYGSTIRSSYPFRHRVCQLITRSGRFKVLHLKVKDALYNADICGEGLARKINQSWLGLATTSNFDYFVTKYFEIPACGSVVLGNMNEQGRAIFGDNYIHIDDSMTDNQILNVVTEALADRRRLQRYVDHMHSVIHTNYTPAENERRLFEVAESIAGQKSDRAVQKTLA